MRHLLLWNKNDTITVGIGDVAVGKVDGSDLLPQITPSALTVVVVA